MPRFFHFFIRILIRVFAPAFFGDSIDGELKSHETYVVNEVNGQMVFPTVNGPFSALEAHSVYQIGNSGTAASVSFDEAPGQFQYNHAECRFKRIN